MKTRKSDQKEIHEAVREHYGAIAQAKSNCCVGGASCSEQWGYSSEEIGSVPEGADLGLGCGNPVGIASIREGETVLDLGSGAGVDCFLAAKRVGAKGRVIGVDMTPEMVSKASAAAEKGGYTNVEFRPGNIEKLPVTNNSVDTVISNCVINLSPEKPSVFREAFRVLKPGGRLVVSDLVATRPLSDEVRNRLSSWAACIAGAASVAELERMLAQAGFDEIRISLAENTLYNGCCGGVASATIEARKPARVPERPRSRRRWRWLSEPETDLPAIPYLLSLRV